MRIKVLVFAASLPLVSNSSAGIPQSPTASTSSPQAATILGQSSKALSGSASPSEVTFTRTVEWIAGSADETETATYKAVSGAHRMELSFRNGTRSEIVSTVSGVYSGNWVGLDGISHAMAIHNLMSDSGWFPAFTFWRIRLADIDGSGIIDIIYLHGEGVRMYFNQSGNSWSSRKSCRPVGPVVDALSGL